MKQMTVVLANILALSNKFQQFRSVSVFACFCYLCDQSAKCACVMWSHDTQTYHSMPSCSPLAGRVVVFPVHSKDAQPFITEEQKLDFCEKTAAPRALMRRFGWHVSRFNLCSIEITHICSCDMNPSHTLVTVVAAKRTTLRKKQICDPRVLLPQTMLRNSGSARIFPISEIHESSSDVRVGWSI